jgi:hypothetical protein
METVAIYWEPQIKTYGFQVVKELALFNFALPAQMPASWDRAMETIDNGHNRFHLLCGQLNETADIDLMLLCESAQCDSFARQVEAELPVAKSCPRQMICPVELLFFQGPHFGDRFGIADFTYRALRNHADYLLAAVFSSASIYLVLPEGLAGEAKKRLTAAFRIPH